MASEAQSEGSGLVFHPMDQFIVKPLFGDGPIEWYTITNVTLWMALSVVAIIALLVVGTARRAIVPSRSQSITDTPIAGAARNSAPFDAQRNIKN